MDLDAMVRRWELEQLFTDYVQCLDSDELERWPDFFTEDCFYRITSAENYEASLPLGLIYATSRNMLKDRVSALREANILSRSATGTWSRRSRSETRWSGRITSISWRIFSSCARCKTAR